MPKHRSKESIVKEFFETAHLEVAIAFLGFAHDIVKARQRTEAPETVKPRKMRKKQPGPGSADAIEAAIYANTQAALERARQRKAKREVTEEPMVDSSSGHAVPV